MSINLQLPSTVLLKPCITVFGVGGAGCNAVNNMINANLEGAKFVVANTDSQALLLSNSEHKIQLGTALTKGLGAGASPEIGKAAAEEATDEINNLLGDSNMVFITAGMGGGTGTGAAPVIAKLAREKGMLTVAVVTKPFHFEGLHRMRLADAGLKELQSYVDTLIVIPNQNLFKIANAKTTFADAFKMADDVLHAGVRGITDLMIMPGLINLDFADIKTVMSEMGKAMMGTGEAQGENRAIVAAEAAISNPLLDNSSMKGAKGVLINISGGFDMTLFEVDEAANRIREEVDPEANIIFGSAFNKDLEGTIRVSVVATGIEHELSQKEEKKPAAPVTSTIQQMQQLYKDNPASIFTNSPSYPAVAPVQQVMVEKEVQVPQVNIAEAREKFPDVFFSPRTLDPEIEPIENKTRDDTLSSSIKTNDRSAQLSYHKPQKESESISLFGLMANSMRSLAGKNDKESKPVEQKKIIQVEGNEESIITDEILNIPAYQRKR